MITVGQITKPQGVRGEVKVKPLTDDSSRFCVLKTVYIGGKPYKLNGVRVAEDAVYIKFDGINDRNAAELLRGEFITIDKASAKPLSDGEFFIADITGASLYVRGEQTRLGVIVSVRGFGAADVFSIRAEDGRDFSFPFIAALGAEFNEKTSALYVDGDILKQVAVYDED